MLPPLTDTNRAFWTGGASGQLLIERCRACRRWVHPPTAKPCTACGGELTPEAASGTGTIFAFTVNHQRFHPAVEPPYVIAIVVLDEQDDLRITTNIVNADSDALQIGTRVRVVFEPNGEPLGSVHVPLFQPAV